MNHKLISIYLALLLQPATVFAQNGSDKLRNIAEKYYGVDNEKALSFYEKAVEEAKKNNDCVRISNLCVDISSLYHAESAYQKALEKCKEGFFYLSKSNTKPDTLLFKLCSSTGTMFKNLNDKDSTKYYYELANTILERNAKVERIIPEYVLHHFNSYGRWLNGNSDYSNGTMFVEKALSVARKYRLREDENIIRTNLASLYEKLGDFEKALVYRKESLVGQRANNLLMCYNLSGFGWTLILSNKPKEGIGYLTKALHLYNKLRHQNKVNVNFDLHATLLYNLGVGYQKLENYAVAKRYFEKIIEDFKQKNIKKSIFLSKTWLKMSELKDQDLKKSLNYTQEALKAENRLFTENNIFQNPPKEGTINEKILFDVLSQKSKLLFNLYQQNKNLAYLDLSCKTLSDGLATVGNIRGSFDNTASKLFLNTSVFSFYQMAIEIAFEKFQRTNSSIDKAFLFQIIESSKATALSDALFESSIKPKMIPFDLINDEQNLTQKIIKLKEQSIDDTTKIEVLKKLEIEKYNLLRLFEKKYPQYYKLKYENRTVSVSQIQERLDEETVYLSYFLAKDKLFIAIIGHNSFEMEAIAVNTEILLHNAEKFRVQLYQNPGMGNYQGLELSAYLYNYLISPIQKHIYNKTRLMICKGWNFNFLPFEVLESGRFINDYLIKKYSIGYTYSAEIFINQQKQHTNTKVLAVAPYNDKKYNSNDSFRYLPDSETSALAVADKALVGENATKNVFLQSYNQYGIIYFATHSVMNDKNPNQSFIAFNPVNNFKLTTEEIYNLALENTQLVVLSSCEAGIGQSHQSEGMLSIARAFSFAGCPSTVTTLWATNDASTAYLTERFHFYLKRSLPKDVALQKAKLDFLNADFGKKFNHPHFWGNLVLIGNEEVIFSKVPKSVLFYASLIVFCCVLVFFFFKKGGKIY